MTAEAGITVAAVLPLVAPMQQENAMAMHRVSELVKRNTQVVVLARARPMQAQHMALLMPQQHLIALRTPAQPTPAQLTPPVDLTVAEQRTVAADMPVGNINSR